MSNIKKLVREYLVLQKESRDKFYSISLMESDDEKFYYIVEYFNKLYNSGHNDNDLKNILNEQLDLLSKAFGWGTETPENKQKHGEYLGKTGEVVGGGLLEMAKEWMVQQALGYMGFKGPMANALSTALTRMTFADLVSVFSSYDGCMKHSRPIARALSEALVRYIVEGLTEKDSAGANFIRVMLFEYFQTKGYDRKLGQYVCRVAYKNKQNVIKGAKEKFGGRENF